MNTLLTRSITIGAHQVEKRLTRLIQPALSFRGQFAQRLSAGGNGLRGLGLRPTEVGKPVRYSSRFANDRSHCCLALNIVQLSESW